MLYNHSYFSHMVQSGPDQKVKAARLDESNLTAETSDLSIPISLIYSDLVDFSAFGFFGFVPVLTLMCNTQRTEQGAAFSHHHGNRGTTAGFLVVPRRVGGQVGGCDFPDSPTLHFHPTFLHSLMMYQPTDHYYNN